MVRGPQFEKRCYIAKVLVGELIKGALHFNSNVEISLPELKQPEHKVIHRPSASAMVKNEWRCSPLPLYVSMAWTGRNLP